VLSLHGHFTGYLDSIPLRSIPLAMTTRAAAGEVVA
jgi:hypothetical protein